MRLLLRARKAPDYSKRWRERFGFALPAGQLPQSIWLHAVSVGETIAAQPLINRLLKEQPLPANEVMNTIMDIFNIQIIYVCIGFMVVAEIIKLLVGKFSKLEFDQLGVTKRRYVKERILGIMIVLAIYMGSFLRPEMHEVNKLKNDNPTNQQLQIRSDRVHSKFVNIYAVNMILGLSLFYIHGKEMTRFRKTPNETDE